SRAPLGAVRDEEGAVGPGVERGSLEAPLDPGVDLVGAMLEQRAREVADAALDLELALALLLELEAPHGRAEDLGDELQARDLGGCPALAPARARAARGGD